MSKDRARPFSAKHRKYWIPVTGGMLLIGVLNVGLGLCLYVPPGDPPQRIVPSLPEPTPAATATDGTIGRGEVPATVMRAFAAAYPRHIPTAKRLDATTYELTFEDDKTSRRVTFRADGSFVSEHAAAPR